MLRTPTQRLPLHMTLIMLAGVVLLTGCQQPAANGGGRAALLDFSRLGNSIGGNGSGTNQQYAGRLGSAFGRQPTKIQTSTQEQYEQFTAMAEQLRVANQRLAAYDADNQQLNTEMAASRQKLQLANQYSQTLKEQLGDTSTQIRQAQNERQSAMQELASMRLQVQQANLNQQRVAQQPSPGQLAGFSGSAPSRLAGGATIRANNSLMNSLSRIQIPGGQARMDGDVIRIEFPSDRLFVPGSYQIQPAQQSMLKNLTGTIQQTFPRQIVGIEAHWDGTPLTPVGTSDHQLTATQSLAMLNQLVEAGLPRQQLFTMAMASNRPRHPGGTENRRIEVVIYPETYDGR